MSWTRVDKKIGTCTADSVLMFLRTNAAISMLGLNVVSSMRQLVSLSNAVAEAGLPAILSGIEQVALDHHGIKQFVYKLDPQVKYRFGQIEPSLREMMEGKEIQRYLSGKPGLKKQMLFLIRKFDEFAVLSVWKGSYDSAINKGKSQQEAINYASAVMRKTQPMVAAKDLPQWFRDGMVVKLFNMFQNQINKNFNYINHDIFGKLKHGKISPYTAAHRLLFGWFVPSVLLGMISRGRRPKDWKEIVQDMAVYYAGGAFFFGAFAVNAVKGYGGYVTPILAFGTDIVKAATYKTTESRIKAGISAASTYFFIYPCPGHNLLLI
ncbi:unnamed protein product [marine sediment metagenome]|uniref:Uncharacterized protein n=1 Tax=marine sediment metagenome TaxID=412755 RepID=X0ZR04_9ZZZZ